MNNTFLVFNVKLFAVEAELEVCSRDSFNLTDNRYLEIKEKREERKSFTVTSIF